MDTKLGPIIGPYKPREAESADTRYGLLGQGSGFSGYRREGREEASLDRFDEDEATVSTEALLLFLESILIRQYGLTAEESLSVDYVPEASAQRPTAGVEALRLKAAEAAKAYAHAAHVSRKVARKNQKPDVSEQTPSYSEDIQQITRLIRDLRLLSAQSVDRLQVERGATLIESLAAAIVKAKQELPV
ncbi:MAG: hypothetical protein IPH06_05855 [Alphaproteobacteria bacterium]|nr:hypothetical protein [Alphaproteobacteria bacterium]QQS57543.1 MAG: hypothetical protein IPN28_01620 [Alphaproteobacteria bacterium]